MLFLRLGCRNDKVTVLRAAECGRGNRSASFEEDVVVCGRRREVLKITM